MEKLIFLFRRKPGLTREQYHDHYIKNHAPLGLRLTQNLEGYTVNLVDTASEVDAVTEIWTPSAADFMVMEKTFATPEDGAAVVADHTSFMGPQDAFVVEETVVRAGSLDSPVGVATPGVKVVELHRDAESLPDVPDGAARVVDNRVVRAFIIGDQPVDPAASDWGDQRVEPAAAAGLPDVEVIRMLWASDAETLGAPGPHVLRVREYRNRVVAG